MIKGIMSNASAIKGIMSKDFSAIRCLDFNDSTDYVDCGNVLNMGTSDFTLEAWIKTSESARQVLLRKKLGSVDKGYSVEFNIADKKISLEINDGSGNILLYSDIINNLYNGNPHHIIIGVDRSDKVYFYFNLEEVGTGDISGKQLSIDNDFNFYISWLSRFFNGLICGGRIYKNKALNTTERQNNFNGKITQDGLVAEWLMREQQGSIIHDTSINSNHGTIYGADWYEEKFNTPLKGIMSNSSEITGIMTAEYI